jgi:BTB/POZ domain
VILKDVAFEDLQTVVKFMYHGIVNVSSDKLPGVLKVTERLEQYNRLSVLM